MANYYFKCDVFDGKDKFKKGDEISDKHPMFKQFQKDEFLADNKGLTYNDPKALSNELDSVNKQLFQAKEEIIKLKEVIKTQESIINGFEKSSKKTNEKE